MHYISTRGGAAQPISAAQAIIQGIAPDGGLYVPKSFPQLDPKALLPLSEDYRQLAAAIIGPYLAISPEEALSLANRAYGAQFDTAQVAPLVPLGAQESILELWHGPTLAFKDMALQMLPHLMRHSMLATGEAQTIYILVATSGDTGKAALAGFQDVPGTAVQVFYPHNGVSHAQFLQMATQEGANVHVCGIEGNFDDAQTAVKRIFADADVNRRANALGYRLSSANSINFGRLLPQIVYYYSAYLALCRSGRISMGDVVDYCVPTGNFGNILAGYYAMRMGLPVGKLLCASNRNNVLTDFFHNGIYNSKRPFYTNMSCSIDILVSSNLERLLFEMADRDATQVRDWMQALSGSGSYTIGPATAQRINACFAADWCDEEATLSTIRRVFETTNYLMDPHTAVAQTFLLRYREESPSDTHTVLLSTAHPYKFASDVLQAFEPLADTQQNSLNAARRLFALTGCAIPPAITQLYEKPILHQRVCAIAQMPDRVLEVLS